MMPSNNRASPNASVGFPLVLLFLLLLLLLLTIVAAPSVGALSTSNAKRTHPFAASRLRRRRQSIVDDDRSSRGTRGHVRTVPRRVLRHRQYAPPGSRSSWGVANHPRRHSGRNTVRARPPPATRWKRNNCRGSHTRNCHRGSYTPTLAW